MNIRLYQLLILFSLLTSAAPAQESLAYMLRSEGHAVEADAITAGLVTFDLSPAWLKSFQAWKNTEERKAAANLIASFLDTRLKTEKGLVRSLPTGLMLAAMEEAKKQNSLRIELRYSPTKSSRKHTVEGMNRLAEAITKTPGGKRKLAFSFDPEAESILRSALRDHGSEIFLTLPASRAWNVENVQVLLH